MPTRSTIYCRVIPGRHKHSDAGVPSRGHDPAEDIKKKRAGKGRGSAFLSQGRTPSSAREGHTRTPAPMICAFLWRRVIYLARCGQSFTDAGATYSRARENKGCLLCAVCCDGSSRLTLDRRPRNSLRSGINRARDAHVRLLNVCLYRKPAAQDARSTR